MRTRLIMITLAAIVLFAGLVPPAAIAQTTSTSSLIVKVIAGLTADQQAAIVGRNGGVVTSSIPALRLLVVSAPQEELDATLARYQADPQVQSAEPNKVRVSESIPSDALYANQWALPRIGWDQVFGVVTPTGSAKVAVLDTGVDASHPELAGKVVPGTSILDGSNGMTDPSGHGTWLAGIIAAQTNNGFEGIAGVAYDGVTIMPVTVLNANGEGQDSDVIAGVIWAADHGANVILMAFSNPGFSPNLQDAIDYAWSRGVVIVASAGNNASSEPHFPAGDRGVMGVAATDQGDAQAFFSNEGPAVFIAAPGTDIATTDPGGAYTAITGTSAAAAHVAGLAAFMKAVNPALPNGIIVFRIASTADPAGTQTETGNGRINMARALISTATNSIQPAGAAPVGGGGPFVGPYRADGNATLTGTVRNAVTNAPISGATVTISCPGCNGPDQTKVVTTNASGVYTSGNLNYPGSGTISGTVSVTATGFQPGGPTSWSVGNGQTVIRNFALTPIPSNTAPSIAFTAGPTVVNENTATQQTYTFSITDPDAGDSWTFVSGYPTCGVGGSLVAGSATIDNAAKTGTFKCIFADGPANPTVAAKVKDAANAESNEATRGVTVSNVAPTVAFTAGSTNVDESGVTQYTYNYSISDPGDDTITSVSTSCGANGLKVAGSDTNNNTSGSFKCIFPDGPASSTVTAQATDSDGAASNTAERAVTVNNVAPTVAFTAGPTTVDESGVTQHTYDYSITDPGNDTITSVSTSCGTNGLKVASSDTNNNTSGSFKCIFPDGPASSTVTAQATDSDGLAGNTAQRVVYINNVAPTVTAATGPGPTAVNTLVSIKADFTDPGSLDTHTCQFVWGDGTSGPDAIAAGTGNGSCTGTHTYTAAGVYTVLITATDKDSGVSAVYSYEFVVIYDPSAGFVTGGGWILSPPGAYIAQPSATGKANFGFVSKYKKGMTVPTGETEFQFHAGGMNFHSEEYQYLVIAGAKAQYKGIGSVNGAGNYGFLLTATDGNLKTGDGIDRFRIKIWDRATGVVIYDNAPSADPDTEDLNQIFPQAISGGSIVIHSGK